MDAFPKTISTIAIWVLSVGLSMSTILFNSGSYNGDSVLMMILPLVFAMLTTAFIWIGKAMLPWIPPDILREEMRPTSRPSSREESYEKSKRSAQSESKLDMLLSMMDDDEREAFKETLKRQVLSNMRLSDEGELPAGVDNLWDEEPQQRRRY